MSPNKQVVSALLSLSALAPQPVRADILPKVFTALEEATEDITESVAAPAGLKAAIAKLKLEQPKALAESEATQHAERLAEVWERLRPRVPETARVARDAFAVEVANLLKSVAVGHAEATATSARAIEELVDKLEDTFPAR